MWGLGCCNVAFCSHGPAACVSRVLPESPLHMVGGSDFTFICFEIRVPLLFHRKQFSQVRETGGSSFELIII